MQLPRFAPWFLAIVTLLPLHADIFPEVAGSLKRGDVHSIEPQDPELYKEFGFVEAEQTEYSGAGKSVRITGWKLKDSTGALALFQMLRPADAKPSKVAQLAAETPDGLVTAYGNYVFEYAGFRPTTSELDELLVRLKNVDRSALPALIAYLPHEGLIPNSERYILGPVSLDRFAPQIQPSLAAFHLEAEGEQGRYKTASGEIAMTILNYPTPNMARERQDAFLKVPGVVAKRSGPLVAVIYPPDAGVPSGWADDAERVVDRVDYEFQLTREHVGTPPVQGMANLVLTGFLFAGVLFAGSLLAGLWLGGFRPVLQRFGWAKEPERMTVLRLGNLPEAPRLGEKPPK